MTVPSYFLPFDSIETVNNPFRWHCVKSRRDSGWDEPPPALGHFGKPQSGNRAGCCIYNSCMWSHISTTGLSGLQSTHVPQCNSYRIMTLWACRPGLLTSLLLSHYVCQSPGEGKPGVIESRWQPGSICLLASIRNSGFCPVRLVGARWGWGHCWRGYLCPVFKLLQNPTKY